MEIGGQDAEEAIREYVTKNPEEAVRFLGTVLLNGKGNFTRQQKIIAAELLGAIDSHVRKTGVRVEVNTVTCHAERYPDVTGIPDILARAVKTERSSRVAKVEKEILSSINAERSSENIGQRKWSDWDNGWSGRALKELEKALKIKNTQGIQAAKMVRVR
ncbi:MAG: hypothetical protein AB1468_00790 [Candidatus Micrarchaeota archaeon]